MVVLDYGVAEIERADSGIGHLSGWYVEDCGSIGDDGKFLQIWKG